MNDPIQEDDRGAAPAPADERSAALSERDVRRALREQSQQWATTHRSRVDELQRELLCDCAHIGPDHGLLLRTAAMEAGLAARLADVELQLIERAGVLVDSPEHVAAVARALKEVVAVSGAISARVESLLGAASVIRAQRELGGKTRSHLRAVA